jgi:hypothetical protein
MHGTKQEKIESKKSTEKLKAARQSDATDDEVLQQEESRRNSQTAENDRDRITSPDGAFVEKEEADKADPI